MTPLRPILLAEDSRADAEMTIDALQEAHVANPVVHVEDGVEALDYLHRRGKYDGRDPNMPAVVLLDIKMPRMDGVEVLRALRADNEFRHMPIVILSSSREERDVANCWDLGVNAYVVKPHDIDKYFETVRTIGQFWGTINEAPAH
ncbi:MAG: response regulator [Xanthomonadales bacterium]|nr:response regulator [Xanthomonadales bacterium]